MLTFSEPSLSIAGGELKLVLSAEEKDPHTLTHAQSCFEVLSTYLQPAKGFSVIKWLMNFHLKPKEPSSPILGVTIPYSQVTLFTF